MYLYFPALKYLFPRVISPKFLCAAFVRSQYFSAVKRRAHPFRCETSSLDSRTDTTSHASTHADDVSLLRCVITQVLSKHQPLHVLKALLFVFKDCTLLLSHRNFKYCSGCYGNRTTSSNAAEM